MPVAANGPGRYPKYDTIPTQVKRPEAKPRMPLIISNNTRNQVIVAAILFLLGWLVGQ